MSSEGVAPLPERATLGASAGRAVSNQTSTRRPAGAFPSSDDGRSADQTAGRPGPAGSDSPQPGQDEPCLGICCSTPDLSERVPLSDLAAHMPGRVAGRPSQGSPSIIGPGVPVSIPRRSHAGWSVRETRAHRRSTLPELFLPHLEEAWRGTRQRTAASSVGGGSQRPTLRLSISGGPRTPTRPSTCTSSTAFSPGASTGKKLPLMLDTAVNGRHIATFIDSYQTSLDENLQHINTSKSPLSSPSYDMRRLRASAGGLLPSRPSSTWSPDRVPGSPGARLATSPTKGAFMTASEWTRQFSPPKLHLKYLHRRGKSQEMKGDAPLILPTTPKQAEYVTTFGFDTR
mmetsp:Transcript_676/g.1667  ORF Transcript_676/g.1667 Transcript_676/m.1667 type:complete len:344 (+) Transcript_676:118-1149(+)